MNIEEIRKNAPKGATHYNDTDDIAVVYFRQHQGRWQFFGFMDEWIFALLSFENIKPL